MTPDEIHGLKVTFVAVVGLLGVLATMIGLAHDSDGAISRRQERDLDALPPEEYASHVQWRTK